MFTRPGKPGYPHLPRRENAILPSLFDNPNSGLFGGFNVDPEKTPGDSPMNKLPTFPRYTRPGQHIKNYMGNHHV